MVRALLFVIIVGALALMVLSLLRRTPKIARDHDDDDTTQPLALPASLAAEALAPSAVFRKLYEIAFGAPLGDSVPTEHVRVATAVVAALPTAATDPKYAPRRPMLLPQLMRAVNDSDTTRKELAHLVARDPALVGSLLKLANSPLYRRGNQPIEGVERALAVLGTEGARSLVAAALVQPVFRSTGDAGRFPEVVWEHTYRAAASAEVHAAAVEGADLFAAQLIALVLGLGTIIVYRVALDQYKARGLAPDATALASLIEEQSAGVARTIASSWELSERVLDALAEQVPGQGEPESALGRSLRFGRLAGALSVLRTSDVIDDDVGLASLAAAGGTGPRFEKLWSRLSWPER